MRVKNIKFLQYQNYQWFATRVPKVRDILTFIEDDMIQLHFPFKSGQKLVYINSQYTFNTLAEALKLETLKDINIDLQEAQLDINSNIHRYMLSQQSINSINIFVDNEQFILRPAYQYSVAKYTQNRNNQLSYSPTKIYEACQNQNIDSSHANPLSWMLTSLNKQLSQQNKNFTLNEIEQLISNSFYLMASPIKNKLNRLKHQINVCDAEIQKYLKEKQEMENEAQKNAYLWISGIFGISVSQFIFFYYGIYLVEDWGWNVLEPFTYSIQCLSALITLRFYLKYRKQRQSDTILHAFMINRMKNNRIWKDRYNYIEETIEIKQKERQSIEQQILIYSNRVNYDNYESNLELYQSDMKQQQ